ncbi:hypothetical protein CH251_10460 [Rhodococcus sp. 06-462-5]|uniref:hypothetical protein n=1 Tax=unclassified Rhodococcus (in: high G+C Gram-positive bacteria) TaxID=192944 RepID=UPI000B9A8C2F|nr:MULTISPECIES: hypothetical protein [unclassified Rhodococcus (in: high G+C Gram-positive bacteria)]OZC75190.1 hypothetical protein CH251_10460 [Rhodococcus sp. 06-462-5]OZE67707.1 hypothetical protein CH270_08055 [Rhodococcus sp. 02-925g]
MSHEKRKDWLFLLWFALAVTLIGVLLIPSRSGNADDVWYRLAGSDAGRYIGLAQGDPTAYPWGGRWLVPRVASLADGASVGALQALNYLFLSLAVAAITYLAADYALSASAMVGAWAFSATGVALLVLFQNPFLVDSAGLFVFALIGIAYRRENYWALAALAVLGVTIKEVVIGFLLLLLLRRRWRELTIACVLSAGLLYYGVVSSAPGSALLPEFSVGLVVKFAFGLGAAWLLAAIAVLQISRGRKVVARQDLQYFSLTIVLSVAVLPLATDTSRLLVFALPAVVPLCAMALSESGKVRIAVGVMFAIPAVVSVIPSRFTYSLRPQPFEQLESWYSANTELIAVSALLALIGAVVACWPAILGLTNRHQVDARS